MKPTEHYVFMYNLVSVIADGIWVVSVMVDGEIEIFKNVSSAIKYCNILSLLSFPLMIAIIF